MIRLQVSLPQSPHALRAALLLLALAVPTRHAFATNVTSTGNTPYSGIAPGHVNMATGELILVMRPDLVLDGPMPVLYRRYYASMLAREGFASSPLGTNWLGTYDWSLAVGPADVTIVTDRGKRIRFVPGPVGGWDLLSPLDQNYRLTQSSGLWRLVVPSSRRVLLFDVSTNRLTQIVDAHGTSLALSYVGGQLTQVSDGLGRTLTFAYAAGGLLSSVSDGTRSVTYGHTGGDLTSYTDAGNGITTYTYATPSSIPGLLESVVEPLGNAPLHYVYDTSGRVSTLTDALNHTNTYSYDTPTGNQTTDPLGNTWTFLYDAQDRLTTLTDPALGPTSYEYDPQGRLSSMMRPMGDQTSFTYDPASGYLNSVTRDDASEFTYEYLPHSAAGATLFDLSAAHYPDGTNESYVYDPAGNLTDHMDRGGFPWSWTYNGLGEALTQTNPAGGVTTFTYDPAGRLDTRRDDAGNTTRYSYDSFSRLTQIEWPDGPTRMFAYNAMDQLTSLTDERDKTWSYDYDDDHRLVGQTDPLLRDTQLAWDENDRVSQTIDPLGHATVYGYDTAGRLSSVTDRTGHAVTFQYDGLHRLTGILNAASVAWSGSYDPDGRMTSWQDPMGHAVNMGHDFLDQVTNVTDPVSSPFELDHDALGRVMNVTAPLGMGDEMTYDPRGLMTSYRRATSQVDLQRTPLGGVSQVTDPNHDPWPLGHDPQGRPASAADPLGRTESYAYDPRSRLTHADLPIGAVDLTYDDASRLTECQWLDGPTITYSYDDANRMTGATGASFSYDDADRMTSSNGLAMGHDFEGRLTSETYAPGKVVNYTYDNRGLLTGMSDWVGGSTTFSYDDAERLTGMTRPNGTSVGYTYDAAGRLATSVETNPGPSQSPIASIAITHDALGRPASIDRRQPLMPTVTLPGTTGFAYDAASQIQGLSWDGLARLTGDGTRSFVWDGASRLTHYVAGADSPSFTYDAFGRMLSRSLGVSSEQYVWNYGHGRPTLATVVQGGVAKKFYVYTPAGVLLYGIDAATGARHFYHYDERGNTVFLTNGTGSVTTEYAYTPIGGMLSVGATADNPFTWRAAGGMIQLGSGRLWSAGAAIYDAATLRVISGGAVNSGINPGPVQANPGPSQGQPGPVQANPGPVQVGPGPVQIGPGPVQAGPGPIQMYASTNHREDLAGAAAYFWLSSEPSAGNPLGIGSRSIDAPDAFLKSIAGLKVEQEVVEYSEGGLRAGAFHIRPARPPRGPALANPAGPCHFCPKGAGPVSKPMFSKMPQYYMLAEPANQPSFQRAFRLDPLSPYYEPNLEDVLLYADDWLAGITKEYFEEEYGSGVPLGPHNRPGLGDPLRPWKPTPIGIWRFTDPWTGTDSFDTRWLVDYPTPIVAPCVPCQ